MFVHGSTEGKPTQNTQSELTDSGEKWEGAKMLYKEIEKIRLANNWFEICELECTPRYYEGIRYDGAFDYSDIDYITELMERNPKFARMMPSIILLMLNMHIEAEYDDDEEEF